MKIFIHKVRMSIQDGWGRNHGNSIENLGYFSTNEKALESKLNRDSNESNSRYNDIGSSWIEQEELDK